MQWRGNPLKPWIRAESETRFGLYWAGVSTTPWREQEKRWFSRFLLLFTRSAAADSLLPCFFLETRAIHQYCPKRFLQESLEYRVMTVLSRRPWEPLPEELPAEEAEALRRQEKPFALENYLYGLARWFRNFPAEKVIPSCCGLGGATMLFVPPDPATTPPPVDFPPGVKKSPHFRELFTRGNPVDDLKYLLLLRHKGLAALKQAFGRGVEDSLMYQAVPVLIPRLRSQDFFSLDQPVLDALFGASPIYLADSPEEQGIVIASSKPIDDRLASLVDTVNQQLAAEEREGRIQ